MEALTKTGRVITRTVEGRLSEVKNEAAFDGLDILSVGPDYRMYVQSVLKRRLSGPVLASLFMDLATAQSCGLSIHETVASLQETASDVVLKQGLRIVGNGLNDGRSLKEALEAAKCFPKIAVASMAAAEKSGRIPEVAAVLGRYFQFNSDCRKRIIGALFYPAAVFSALTAASVVMSVYLVPALSKILPASDLNTMACRLFLAYALWMKHYWVAALLAMVGGFAVIGYGWSDPKERFAQFAYRLPWIGQAFKDTALAQLFLNLYVYQKSGISIVEAMANIHRDDKSYVNERLLAMRGKIHKGISLAEAFQEDPFFPSWFGRTSLKARRPVIWSNTSRKHAVIMTTSPGIL